MRAAILQRAGSPLEVIEAAKPKARHDGVVIKMLAAPVLSYMHGVISGTVPYMLPPTPFTPGSDLIGVVDHVGSEVFDLEPGTLVHARPQIASRGYLGSADAILIGLTGMSPEALRVQNIWPDGAYAEFAHYPIDCVTPLSNLSSIEPAKLGALMYLAVGYGGLLAADLKPGESVIIGGATGNFGAHALLVALAMGASRIIPTGRKAQVLATLKTLAPDRIYPVVISGDAEKDQANIAAASGILADCYLDITGGGDTGPILSAMRGLRSGGRVSLMGALQDAIQIPYVEIMVRGLTITGNFMYPPEAPAKLCGMINAGLIPLDALQITTYPLAKTSEALEKATKKGGLEFVSIIGNSVP